MQGPIHGPNQGTVDLAARRARAQDRARRIALAALGAGLLHGLLYIGAARSWRVPQVAANPPAAVWIQAAQVPAELPVVPKAAPAVPTLAPALAALEPRRAEPTRATPKPRPPRAKPDAEPAAAQPSPPAGVSVQAEVAHHEAAATTMLAPANAAPPSETVEVVDRGAALKPPAPPSVASPIETAPTAARGNTVTAPPDAPASTAALSEPVPVYATLIPPATTLQFRMRRGMLHGKAELAWKPDGGRYEARFEANVSGLTLLTQVSQGGFDAAGLAPQRFTDKRPRRSATAANFQRAAGPAGAKVTFSGSASEVALHPGAQDRLSWMVQLSAIAGAEPQRLAAQGRILMHVIGARADAAVWQFVSSGEEVIAANPAPLRVVHLQRLPQSAYDTRVDIWLEAKPPHWLVRAHLSHGPNDPGLELWRIDSAEPR
jgi:hypothetical protein